MLETIPRGTTAPRIAADLHLVVRTWPIPNRIFSHFNSRQLMVPHKLKAGSRLRSSRKMVGVFTCEWGFRLCFGELEHRRQSDSNYLYTWKSERRVLSRDRLQSNCDQLHLLPALLSFAVRTFLFRLSFRLLPSCFIQEGVKRGTWK